MQYQDLKIVLVAKLSAEFKNPDDQRCYNT